MRRRSFLKAAAAAVVFPLVPEKTPEKTPGKTPEKRRDDLVDEPPNKDPCWVQVCDPNTVDGILGYKYIPYWD